MFHRTALSQSLDKEQKESLLSHSIWTVDDLTDESLQNLSDKLQIPNIIKSPKHILQRSEELQEYFCGIESIDIKISSYLAGCISEISGLPGSGRTTLCLRYAKSILPKNTLWIDTEGCLYPPKGLILSVIRIHDHLQIFGLTHSIQQIVDSLNPSLIVIDSIAATMRGEASTDFNRTSLLWELAKTLKVVASEKGIAVLMTNHMSKLQFQSYAPTLGASWQNVPTHSFEIRDFSGSKIFRIVKSPCLPRMDIEMTNFEDEIEQNI